MKAQAFFFLFFWYNKDELLSRRIYLKKGIIIKLIGGLYTVVDEAGKTYTVKPLGIFRYKNMSPKVGDHVMFDKDSITEVSERKNDLYRPQIANVDQALLINAAKRPDFSFLLMDKFLTLIESKEIIPIIVITKIDLLSAAELAELQEKMKYYEKFFRVIYFSKVTKAGLDEILEVTEKQVNVLAGQTGAGKSTLLNTLQPGLNLATDEISEALGRGKHTTRHVELIAFNKGFIADTPGFSKLEFQDFEAEEIRFYYPDFFALSKHCKFYECTHIHEPGCEIIKQYEEGKILKERYENYVSLYNEIKSMKKRYRRD